MAAGNPSTRLVGGIDPHADTIHVAVVTTLGKPVGDAEFRTDPDGYQAAIAFLTSSGTIERVGVEGAAGYGAGITRALAVAGLDVVEVERPTRSDRRRAGKTDQMDAYHAARSVLAGRTSPIKGTEVDALRALNLARRSAVKARTAAGNQLKAVLVMAPDDVRSRYRGLNTDRLVDALRRVRPDLVSDPTSTAVLTALKSLARRHRDLTEEIAALTAHLDTLVTAARPALREAYGVGPDVAAQLLITAGNNPERLSSEASFAALCGVAPVPASSGKTHRHRLSRGGDRQANAALHRIVLNRGQHHAPTKAYVARQTERGRTPREIRRMLKRAVAREVYRLLVRDCPVAVFNDLRPARQAKNITLRDAARQLGTWPSVLSNLERGLRRDHDLTTHYRDWLQAA
ncbi:IS110 family RNA-guided transposase [Microlunatus antarcticus]|jgi:transposase|uniref:IS110 family transposase n=1 Tax=Microlunatus antarcticus TaxID=53388 RepID=UPI00161BFDB6|nr:IS110 family transposase [Microlunatus antarcticus]